MIGSREEVVCSWIDSASLFKNKELYNIPFLINPIYIWAYKITVSNTRAMNHFSLSDVSH